MNIVYNGKFKVRFEVWAGFRLVNNLKWGKMNKLQRGINEPVTDMKNLYFNYQIRDTGKIEAWATLQFSEPDFKIKFKALKKTMQNANHQAPEWVMVIIDKMIIEEAI